MSRPHIHLIATGGTIAGTGSKPNDLLRYAVATIGASELVASVPSLQEVAEVSVESLWSMDSADMTPLHWQELARAVDRALERDEVDGVVVTHGTDTMEESAFFLDLVLPPGKPVVVTGAMRPATALSADGPMMLYSAVLAAADPALHNLGVVVVMDGRIHAARGLRKSHPNALNAFNGGEAGPLGTVPPVTLHRRPTQRALAPWSGLLHTHRAPPRVDMLLVGAGSAPELLRASLDSGADAVVLALPGNCTIPQAWEPAVSRAVEAGAVLVLASRTGEAAHLQLRSKRLLLPISDAWLTPAQARVLTVVSLWDGE